MVNTHSTDHKITHSLKRQSPCGRHHKRSTVAQQVGGRVHETSMQARISEGQACYLLCLAPGPRHFLTPSALTFVYLHNEYMMLLTNLLSLKHLNPNRKAKPVWRNCSCCAAGVWWVLQAVQRKSCPLYNTKWKHCFYSNNPHKQCEWFKRNALGVCRC